VKISSVNEDGKPVIYILETLGRQDHFNEDFHASELKLAKEPGYAEKPENTIYILDFKTTKKNQLVSSGNHRGKSNISDGGLNGGRKNGTTGE
jgi:hypothetical protein